MSVLGRNTREVEPRDLAGFVGAVFQDPEAQLVMTDPRNEIKFGLENISFPPEQIRTRIDEAMRLVNIEGFRDRFVPELSAGEKQKLVLASVLAMDPSLLVLDEPTSQLDPKSAEEILGLLRKFNEERGLTVILAEHRLERCMQFADRVLLMDDGNLRRDDSVKGYVTWARNNNPVFLPPVTLIAPRGMGDVPTTVKEARRIVARELGNGGLSAKRISGPIRRRRRIASVEGVSFGYESGKEVLGQLSLSIREGDRIALLGRNGVGKSTLLKLLNGLLKPVRGRVMMGGMDTREHPTSRLARICGYLSQNPSDHLFERTVEKEIEGGIHQKVMWADHLARLIEELDLGSHLDRYPRDLSVGERERVALTAVMATRPKLLALDEPTRGIDHSQKRAITRILNRFSSEDGAAIVATHDVEFACEFANRVIIIGGGRILADNVPKMVLPGSLLFTPRTNLATRGFSRLGLGETILDPGELLWKGTEAK